MDKFTSNEEFENFKNRSKQLNDKIGEIKRDRNREQARQDKLVQLLKELNSLNREIKAGMFIVQIVEALISALKIAMLILT